MTGGDRTDPEFEMVDLGGNAAEQDAAEPPQEPATSTMLDLVRAAEDRPARPLPPAPIAEVEPLDIDGDDLEAAIISEVKEYFETVGMFTASREAVVEDLDPEFEAFIEERWFDFGYLEDMDVIERYWLNRPYAYVTVLYNPATRTHRYHVSEPAMDTFEQYVRDDLVRILRNSLMYEDIDDEEDREVVFAENAADVIAEHAATVSDGAVQKLFYYVMRDFLGFGKVDALMHDPSIEDISCDGTAVPVFVYHHLYRDLRTNISFDRQTLNSLVVRLAQRAGRHISVSDPLVDATLTDGSRVQLTLGTEVSTRGSNFTIRKFADDPYTPVELVQWETFSVPEMAYFWLAIENGKSLIFAGGTGSGKTTSMNAVSFFIPPDAKVVSIEDTREITLPHDNWIQSVTRRSTTGGDRGDITTYELLQAALRQRPEYLLVGEIRTEQRVALTFFQAIGTGHTAYTTFHADGVDSLLHRLQNPPLSVPAQMLLDLDIVSVQRQTYRDDQRVRRNDIVAELTDHPTRENALDWSPIFEYDGETDTQARVGDSQVLADIADQRGWSDDDLADQIDRRERVLSYLVDNDITDHATVAATIQLFARDPEYVLEQVEAETLDPTTFPVER